MRLRRSSKFNSPAGVQMLLCSVQKVLSPLSYESGRAERNALGQFKRFKVQNATAPQFKVLSPLSYESGRAERNALKRVFYTPEGPYTRRMSLYTSQRLLTRPKGLTRYKATLPARRALHATDVALHAATRPI